MAGCDGEGDEAAVAWRRGRARGRGTTGKRGERDLAQGGSMIGDGVSREGRTRE